MIELRPDENKSRRSMIDGKPTMDEIVATNVQSVHFEMMDNNSLWGIIESEGKTAVCWIRAAKGGRLIFTAEFE